MRSVAKRRARTIALTAAAFALTAGVDPAAAVNSNAGTTGYNFLKIPVGARPAALGGAYTAIGGDLEASAFNPAGLHGVRHRAGVVALTSYLVDTEAGFLSVAMPGEKRTWAASLNYFTYGTLRRTDIEGRDLGTFGAFDVAASVTAAQRVWKRRLVVGASLKAIYSSIDAFTSDAYALDLGIIAPGPIQGMKIGASLANMGAVRSPYADGATADSLPFVLRVGASHRPAHAPLPLIIVADLNVPNDGDPHLAFGAELEVAGKLFLRPGYSLQQTGVGGAEALGLSAGAGLELQRYRFDYAFSSFPTLGDVHRISVTGRM